MRKMSETLRLLEIIDAEMHREFSKEGQFKNATFKLSDGITYMIDNTFTIKKITNKNIQKLPVHFCKGGVYPEVYISGMPIKLYTLNMIAADDAAFEKYSAGLDINHCVISKTEPKLLNIGCDSSYNKGVVIDTAPLRELSADPNYLEFCTRGENVRHGKFIKEFSLYDTYVSAKDVDELKGLLVPYNPDLADMQDDWIRWNRTRVEQFYRSKGVGQQILF